MNRRDKMIELILNENLDKLVSFNNKNFCSVRSMEADEYIKPDKTFSISFSLTKEEYKEDKAIEVFVSNIANITNEVNAYTPTIETRSLMQIIPHVNSVDIETQDNAWGLFNYGNGIYFNIKREECRDSGAILFELSLCLIEIPIYGNKC